MKNWKEKEKEKRKTINKITFSAKSALAPFSNKIWTICLCPSWAAIKRGVPPSFTLKKIEKWETKKKKKNKEKDTINKITWSARSTLAPPFSNKIWTICSCPSWAAIKRGVTPSFPLKKNRKMRNWK